MDELNTLLQDFHDLSKREFLVPSLEKRLEFLRSRIQKHLELLLADRNEVVEIVAFLEADK